MNNTYCGNTSFQVEKLTASIKNLTKHLNQNSKDYQSKKYLLLYVTRKKKLLRYLKNNYIIKYNHLINKINTKN